LYLCYETFYHPSNMVMFVVGNVDPERIHDLVRDHEAKRELTAQPEIVRDSLEEPEAVQQTKVVEEMNIQIPRLMLGFKNVPQQASKEV
ncbi:insulinase family protein, partial [Klebsiella pneumoniae]|nr:insulinase family protein [Klebsiella pneumoniae]